MKTPKNKPMKLFFIAAVLVFMLLGAASTSMAGVLMTISGTVTGGGTPQNGITVALYVGDCWTYHDSTTTAGDGAYSFTDIPSDTYYVAATDNPSNPPCGTDWVSEYWNSGDTEPHSCNNATPVTSTNSSVDFSLVPGYSITGTVYDGAATVSDIYISLILGEACDGEYVLTVTSDGSGDYCITVPPGGPYYLQADPAQSSQDYAQEWYTSSGGTFYSDEAEGITITSSDVPNTDFDLDDGGSISGTVKDNNGDPVVGIVVEASNDPLCFGGSSATTDGTGSFTIPYLAPGPWEVSVHPDPITTTYVYFERDYWLELGEDRNIGAITLLQGALIGGTFVDSTNTPLTESVEYAYGGKFEIGWDYSESNGTFAFRLPVGTYSLYLDENGYYSMLPEEITVTDVGTPLSLGNLTVYDDSTGGTITGAVTESAAHHGELTAVSFLSSEDLSPDNMGVLVGLGMGQPSGGAYSLFVPPSETVDVILVLFSEDEKRLESVTVVDSIQGITSPTAGTPLTGQDLSYTDAGYTVDGYVKSSSAPKPPYRANVLLYAQPGDVFTGFADSDENGYYTFYNVPNGNYKIAVTHPRYPDETAWSSQFTVSADTTVRDIFMGEEVDKFSADFNGDGKADILWRNTSTGQIQVWLMDGETATRGTIYNRILDWDIEDVADFNNDGKADILWRDTSDGRTQVWLMDGETATRGTIYNRILDWDIVL